MTTPDPDYRPPVTETDIVVAVIAAVCFGFALGIVLTKGGAL